jgi:hypothetical protein
MAQIKRSQIRQMVKEIVRASLKEAAPSGTQRLPEALVANLESGLDQMRSRADRPYAGVHSLSFSFTADGRNSEITNVASSEWDPTRRNSAGQARVWQGRELDGHATPITSSHFTELTQAIKRATAKTLRGPGLNNGRYTLNYEVSPDDWPDKKDPLADET